MAALGPGRAKTVREPRTCRIIFSIAFFGRPSPELLVFSLTKSRITFYGQIERGSFRTASVDLTPSVGAWRMAGKERTGAVQQAESRSSCRSNLASDGFLSQPLAPTQRRRSVPYREAISAGSGST